MERAKQIKPKSEGIPVLEDANDTQEDATRPDTPTPIISITPPMANITNIRTASRAAKLGLAIQNGQVKDSASKPNSKLQVTNGLDKENLSSSPQAASTPTATVDTSTIQPVEITPLEFRRKRDANAKISNDNVKMTNPKSPAGLPGVSHKDIDPAKIKRKESGKKDTNSEKRHWVRQSVEMKPIEDETRKVGMSSAV